ncbi:MAG: hypothetical protein ACOY7L_18200 [Pseudomonadota bacterium]
MRPDPTLWPDPKHGDSGAQRQPREGFFGEPISAAIAGVALTFAAMAIPGRLALSFIMELIR